MKAVLRRLWHEQSGDDNVEYALLVAIIALVAVYRSLSSR
jgi:Flp pilus assembly pilin Flp